MKAEIIYLYAYDIAQEADLPVIETALRGSAEWVDLGRLKDAPRAFPVYRPLSIQINDGSGEGPAGLLTYRPSVKLLSVGALSVKIRIPVQCGSLMDLFQYRDLKFKDGSTLDARAHAIARQVFDKIKPLLDAPVEELPKPEGYTVFCVTPPVQVGDPNPDSEDWLARSQRAVAALLVGEPDPARLSAQEVEETVKYR